MNCDVPIRELKRGALHVVHLAPERYSALERMYIAARVTRSFLPPDEILAGASRHLSKWAQGMENKAWEIGAWKEWLLQEAMGNWLKSRIYEPRHDSVIEFAGLEYAVWVGGVSLGTIRDIDRHRHFSFEEYTTRALSETLKGVFPDYVPTSEQLREFFYVHPALLPDAGPGEESAYLNQCWQAVIFYVRWVLDSKKENAADIYRGVLPLALRTPFLMGANARAWMEAMAKRTCAVEGHEEYVTLSRLLCELLAPVMPPLAGGVGRWCPQQRSPEKCCRTKWLACLGNVRV